MHRDIKPENIMVSNYKDLEYSEVKIIDFGLAKRTDDAFGNPSFGGTWGYIGNR
jgi:serine/threonine protein kinase